MTSEGLKLERDVERGESITRQTGSKMNTTIVVLLVLAIAGLIADRLIPEAPPPAVIESVSVESTSPNAPQAAAESAPATGADEHSIAVLPFVNMSGDPENEYFSDGLSEELLNALVRLGGLKVTGRTSSFAFKGRNEDLREVGRLLSVANVLEGSVRKAGNRVRITAQLVKASDGYHLWSDTFDRELDDIFAIQQEIAEQVTQALHVTLLGNDAADISVVVSPSRSAEAYEEYLRGMYVLQQNPDNEEALAKARAYFARALEMDGQYLDGHWGMFRMWDRMHRNGHVPFDQSAEQMKFYAAILEQLAPGSEQSLSARARSAVVERDFARYAELLEEAVTRFPGSARILAQYGAQSITLGGFERGLEITRQAVQLDPLSLEYLTILAAVQHKAGECNGLRETLERAIELDPGAGRVRYSLAMCIYETEGDAARVLTLAEEEPLGFMHDTALAIFHHRLGNPEEAQRQLDSMFEAYGDTAAYQYGQVYSQWGDIAKALEWLEKGVEINDAGMVLAGTDALLDPLREMPEFQVILQSAGFQ